MAEQWKEYGQTGYFVSNFGRVKHNGRILKPWNNTSQKYFQVTMHANGRRTKPFLHRMVATLFVPNVDNKPEVDHIDGNPYNNRANNLRWVTGKENMRNRTPELRSLSKIRRECTVLQIDPNTNIAVREWTPDALKLSPHRLDKVKRCCSSRNGGSYHGFRWVYLNRQMALF